MMTPYRVSWLPVLCLLGSIALLGVGCSNKTIQYPEDHERYLRIDQAVESLRHAYVKKDSSDLASLMKKSASLFCGAGPEVVEIRPDVGANAEMRI